MPRAVSATNRLSASVSSAVTRPFARVDARVVKHLLIRGVALQVEPAVLLGVGDALLAPVDDDERHALLGERLAHDRADPTHADDHVVTVRAR